MKTQNFSDCHNASVSCPWLIVGYWQSDWSISARRGYKNNRFNCDTSWNDDPPFDGKITWIKGRVKGNMVHGVKNETTGYYEYGCRYDEGDGDKEWMRKKDCEYLAKLLKEGTLRKEEPEVWYLREIDQAQGMDIGEWWSQRYCNKPDVDEKLANAKQNYEHFIKGEGKRRAEQAAAEKARVEQERKRREEEQLRMARERRGGAKREAKERVCQIHHTFIPNIPYQDLKLEEEIGRGGFGVVYRGKWKYQQVAIKQSNVNISPEALNDFKKEAEIMINSHSPRIVSLYGISIGHSGRCSIVMEYMEKGSLYDALHVRKEAMAWSVRLRVAQDITGGLCVLHGKGIWHRDLKSLNVLLDERYRAKLTDFGLSSARTESQSQTTIKGNKAEAGTPQWMAPEQIPIGREIAKFTKKTDSYSYGMILVELANSKLPFPNMDNMQVMFAVKSGTRPEINPDCPQKFAELIRWCWRQNPEERPTIDQAAEEIFSMPTHGNRT